MTILHCIIKLYALNFFLSQKQTQNNLYLSNNKAIYHQAYNKLQYILSTILK